jgi:23S rRNA (uracil1939-C5)-methyltransferase
LPANRVLIQELLHLSQIQPHQRVTELYCGVGNLSLPLAAQARELIGIEQDSSAVADAEENAARAGLTNVRFLCMAVLAGVRSVLHQGIRSDLVVLDPPRTGAADVIEAVARLQAPRVIYVSCDPTTLARDLRKLGGYGYRLSVLQPLDLFPQTYHVETIAVSVLT